MECLNSESRIARTRLRRQDEDGISNLPDAVLQHILAFVSTKDAVRTSTLSRRWQNLWKLTPCLDLGINDFSDENDLLNFVDKFINFRGNADLPKFQLICDSSMELETCYTLKSWIYVIIMCKPEHLNFSINSFWFPHDYKVEMPQSLFWCNTLVVLKLFCVAVDVPERVSLSCLKIMHLDELIYANDSAFRILISGCPILEELSILRSDEDNVQLMCICSQTLKLFSVEGDYSRGQVDGILIDAPHLEYLSLSDHMSVNLVINGLGSCLEAKIDVTFDTDIKGYDYELEADDSLRSNIRRFLVEISNIKSLRFSPLTLELLSQYLKLDTLPQFHGVIHLETNFEYNEWEALPALLICCPNLKSFVLDCRNRSDEPLIPQLFAPQCLSSLESITLQNYLIGDKAVMGIIQYFLKNAVVLKKMTIQPWGRRSLEPILKELLTFPRRSSACRIFFE